MKYSFKPLIVNVIIAAATFLSSCKKEASLTSAESAAIQAAVQQTQAVAVSKSTTTQGDSVYVVNTCTRQGKRDSISFSNLPSVINTYLSTNYPGNLFQKAFVIKDALTILQGYVVIIQFNSNPVGLKFDASGNFVQVLEQREGHDLLGEGFHRGGCFENRDGRERDTIALTALPASITSYFVSNYSTDTLVRASKSHEGGYVVISKNNGVFATIFDASGIFINRITLPAPHGRGNTIEQSALPATVLQYLSSTYPGYVFNKAFSLTDNGIVQGYCVVIEANNTKYGIQFDANGNFVRVKTIH